MLASSRQVLSDHWVLTAESPPPSRVEGPCDASAPLSRQPGDDRCAGTAPQAWSEMGRDPPRAVPGRGDRAKGDWALPAGDSGRLIHVMRWRAVLRLRPGRSQLHGPCHRARGPP